MNISLDKQEVNTVLAALRYYQQHDQGEPSSRSDEIQGIASNDGDDTSLDDGGIDELCEKINSGPAEPKPDTPRDDVSRQDYDDLVASVTGKAGGDHDDLLDDLVHQLASEMGSAINNNGMPDQVWFILAELGTKAAREEIERLLKGVADPAVDTTWEPAGCECDNTHQANDTVCRWCWNRGRRRWIDPEVCTCGNTGIHSDALADPSRFAPGVIPAGWYMVERCDSCEKFSDDGAAAGHLYSEHRMVQALDGFHHEIANPASRRLAPCQLS